GAEPDRAVPALFLLVKEGVGAPDGCAEQREPQIAGAQPGTSSSVVRTRAGSANPSTHFRDAFVLYFSPSATVTASRMRALRTSLARTGTSSPPTCIIPLGCVRKARNHPVGLSFQERTKTRPSMTTTQTPV